MIRIKEIQERLSHVVGWEQHYIPELKIDNSLCESESGLYFQGAHPLCTLENIRAIMPERWCEQYEAWDSTKWYQKGAKCKHAEKYWEAKEGNALAEPGVSPVWEEFRPLSDFVRNLTNQGIAQAVQTFLQIKQLSKETQSLLERRTLFDGAARLKALIDPTHKIVGLEIVPVRAMGVTTKIERIGLQMVGGVGKITMYLFHSSQYAPIKEIKLNYTNDNGGFQWFVPEEPLYLPYISGESTGNDAGGAWFLCYNQDDLPRGMFALNVSKDWSKEPCQTCLGGSIDSWREITKYLQVSPFAVNTMEEFATYPQMFDIDEVAYTNTVNYGINLEISVGCDVSDFIMSQRDIFATVIQKQVAANVLRTIAMNPDVRVNRNQVNVTRDEILYELDGAPQGRASGLGYDLKQAYKALTIDTRGLDRICLTCNNHGVKYRTV